MAWTRAKIVGRSVSPGRRPHCPRGPHHGAAQRRARSWRRDLRADRGDGGAAHCVGRMASFDQQGRYRRRARGVRHRQLRAPDRADVRPERALDPGRAPVHRATRSRSPSRPIGRPAAASSPCCASRIDPTIFARSGWAGSWARTRPALRRASPTVCRIGSARACSRAIWSASCRTSRRPSGGCLRSPAAA